MAELRRAAGPPTNLVALVRFLAVNPDVLITHPITGRRGARFREFRNGLLWWEDGTHFPIECGMASSETGVEFDDAGFFVTKFGIVIRVDYLPAAPSVD